MIHTLEKKYTEAYERTRRNAFTFSVSYVYFFFLVAKNIAHNNTKRKKPP